MRLALVILFTFLTFQISEAEAQCGGFGKTFSLTPDVSFGNSYRKSLSQNFKPYGACVVEKAKGHPVRLGQQSIRFEVKTGDCGWDKDGKWSDCKTDRARHELSGRRHSDGEYWYAWSIYFPKDFVQVFPTKLAIGQFHQYKGHVVWMFQNQRGGYYVDDQVVGITAHMRQLLTQDQMEGQWNDILVHANWTHEPSGFFKVWVNGELGWHHTGATKSKGKKVYQKFGVYQSFLSRYKKRNKTDTVPGQVVYYDEIRTAKSCQKLKLEDLGYDCVNLAQQEID